MYHVTKYTGPLFQLVTGNVAVQSECVVKPGVKPPI